MTSKRSPSQHTADGSRRRFFHVTALAAGGLALAGGAKAQPAPLANACVSFGAWPSDPPLDRLTFAGTFPPNIHRLIPSLVTVKAGGSVNFVIAGFHQIAVYGPGTQPGDIDVSKTTPVPGTPAGFPPLIDDSLNRVYRGPIPFPGPLDRTEVVHFTMKGLHLVICSFLPHFARDNMYGWVEVLP